MKYLKILLKFALAFGLILWLISNGSLDFSLILKLKSHISTTLLGLFLIVSGIIISSTRWRALLQLKTDIKLPYWEVIKLNWIGVFFSSIIPGGVSGDLIKIIYAKKLDEENFSYGLLLTTALVDRIFGLVTLLSVQGVFSLLYYNQLIALSPQLKMLIHFNFILFMGGLVFFFFLFTPKRLRPFVTRPLNILPKGKESIIKLLEYHWQIGDHPKVFFYAIAISVINHLLTITAFYLFTSPFYEHPIGLVHLLTFVPLGLVSTAIPISPMGMGVGHMMFQHLFALHSISNGASLFNIHFFGVLFANLFGAIPYIFYKKIDKNQLQTLEDMTS